MGGDHFVQPASGSVLIVDDEILVADYVQMIVEDMGLTVVGAVACTQEAMTIAAQHKPSLALVDINLGQGGDGIELARRLQAEHEIKVILISGSHDPQTRKRAASAPISAFVQKPFLADHLTKVIRAAVEPSTSAA